MNLQFADFDADGHMDIVTATFEGHAFLVPGSADGWKEPEHLLDGQGRKIALSLYYDMEANEYRNVDRSPEGTSNPEDHCVSAMVMDWDADGDMDLLLGAKEGRLYLQRNNGKPGAPSFSGVNEPVMAGGKAFMAKGGLTAVRIVDWNGDGLDDLVYGAFRGGGAYWVRNTGKKGEPVFAAPETLIPAPEASGDGSRGPENDWYVDVVDHDGDGHLDLIVGGHYLFKPRTRELTDEEDAQLAVLQARKNTTMAALRELMAAHRAKIDDANEDEREALEDQIYEDPKYLALIEELDELEPQLSKLSPTSKRTSGVWFYRSLKG